MSRPTKAQLFERLMEIALTPAFEGDVPSQPVICADGVDQAQLFLVQERLMTLIDDLEPFESRHRLPFMYRYAGGRGPLDCNR